MKTRTFVALLILVLVMPIIAESGTKKKPISDEELIEAFTGTWINEEYYPGKSRAKIVLFADGTWQRYANINSTYYCDGKYTILDKWKDRKGNIWFECRWECFTHNYSGHQLTKISDSGNTFEELYTKSEKFMVEEWDTDNIPVGYRYGIYYRQE